MPNLTLCFRIRFRRKNIEAAINLKGISIDDFGVELFSKLDRERSFPDRSGTDDKESIVHEIRIFSERGPHSLLSPWGDEGAKRQMRFASSFPKLRQRPTTNIQRPMPNG